MWIPGPNTTFHTPHLPAEHYFPSWLCVHGCGCPSPTPACTKTSPRWHVLRAAHYEGSFVTWGITSSFVLFPHNDVRSAQLNVCLHPADVYRVDAFVCTVLYLI